jgi:hypothetical protein
MGAPSASNTSPLSNIVETRVVRVRWRPARSEALLNGLENLRFDDRWVRAGIGRILVGDLAEIDAVLQEVKQGAAVEQ